MRAPLRVGIHQTAEPDGNERLQGVVRLVLWPRSAGLGEESASEEPHDSSIPDSDEVPENEVVT